MRHTIAIIALGLAALFAQAKITAQLVDGTIQPMTDAIVNADANGSYTIAGTPISQIKALYNSPLEQPEPGTMANVAPSAKIAAVLDMNDRLGIDEDSDNGRNLYSAEYMMQVAGIPYFVTTSLSEAMKAESLIMLSGYITKTAFTDAEYDDLTKWVEDGGTLVAPAIEYKAAPRCALLFGFSTVDYKKKTHTTLNWVDKPYPELAYIDTDEERETYIGTQSIFTSTYTTSTARVLAKFDGESQGGVICNDKGLGHAYTVGLRWRDMVQRQQLNKASKNRVHNNHFEPSSDVLPLFLRAVYAATNDVVVWKHTIPDGFDTVLIPTHDCDSRTALDEMHWLADYEQSLGLKAHYFITTHYFRQPGYMSAFYCDETIPAIKKLIDQGHTVGSHSVCHFPDFSNTEKFPLTVTTPDDYAKNCIYDVDAKSSKGGSTWAEVVMSKQLLERDLANNVRSFRSGHLCVNANIPEALTIGNYSFASCYASTDLWQSFPFFQRLRNAWTGSLTNVLQMPLHYSDVSPTGESMTEDNWQDAPAVWMDFHLKLKANYAPNILLIHPNKEWKMEVLKMLIDQFDLDRVGLYNFEDYGDFWIKRLEFDYNYAYADGEVTITVSASDLAPYAGQCLCIETEKPLSHVTVTDDTGRVHSVIVRMLTPTRYAVVL